MAGPHQAHGELGVQMCQEDYGNTEAISSPLPLLENDASFEIMSEKQMQNV